MTPEVLAAGDPLPPGVFARLLRRAIFECDKWHLHMGDTPALCPFPLVVDAALARSLARTAEGLDREALAAEAEILGRPDLLARLGLPRELCRVLRVGAAPSPSGPRYARYDFHPTPDGFRITEGNIDVSGGFIEGSGVTALFAPHFPALAPAGDPAGALAGALAARAGAGGRVGLMHLTRYTEDHQIARYLARRVASRGAGVTTCLFDPARLRFREGRAEVLTASGALPLDVVFRFFPADWFDRIPIATRWSRVFSGGRTPFSNPGGAVIPQSKRFPLIWGDLATPLPTWRRLLPETRSPDEIAWEGDEGWVIKPALAHEGDRVAIAGVCDEGAYEDVAREVHRDPAAWIAQRRFEAIAIDTPEGPRYPALGIYVIDGRAEGAFARLARRPLVDDTAQEAVVLLRERR
jgi:glutathionylspermidine synthase